MKSACFSVFLLMVVITNSSFDRAPNGYQLIGIWESEEKNLQIEIFEFDGLYSGRMIYFKCPTDEIMKTLKDFRNPNKTLSDRKLLGLTLVTQLQYQGDNTWDEGKIYDPNSGNVFDARIQMTTSQSATVRGYWKYKWIGKSMVFHRIK